MRTRSSSSLLVSAHATDFLAPQLGRHGLRLDVVTDMRALTRRLRAMPPAPPSALVVEMHPGAPSPAMAVVRLMRLRYPDVPLLVVGVLADVPGTDLMRTVRAGAEHFAFLPDDDVGAMVALLLAKPAAAHLSADKRIAGRLDALPTLARRPIEAMLDHAMQLDNVTALAAAMGTGRRTLERRALANGWPSPREMIVWCRLLRGAITADARRGRATPATLGEAIVASVGCGTAERAIRYYRQYAGVTLRDVAERGTDALSPALIRAFQVVGGRQSAA